MSFLGNPSQICPSQMRDDLSSLPYQLDGVSTFSRSQVIAAPIKDLTPSTLPSQILQLCYELAPLYLPPDEQDQRSNSLSPTLVKLCKLTLQSYLESPPALLQSFIFQDTFKTAEGLIANFQLDLQEFMEILQSTRGTNKLYDTIHQHLQSSHAQIRLALTLSFHAYYTYLKRKSKDSHEASATLEYFGLPSFTKHQGYVKMKVSLFNTRLTSLSLLESGHSKLLGCFITTGGQVLKIGSPRLMLLSVLHRCTECNKELRIQTEDGAMKAIRKCSNVHCKRGNLERVTGSEEVQFFQRLWLKEMPSLSDSSVFSSSSRNSSVLQIQVLGSHCEQLEAGDQVFVSGVLKPQIAAGPSKGVVRYYLAVEGFLRQKDAIVQEKVDESWGDQDELKDDFNFETKLKRVLKRRKGTQKIDVAKLEKHRDRIFALLVASLCPHLYGQELAKAGILLSLFGGNLVKGAPAPFRQQIHVLLIGDPGVGKSQLLTGIKDLVSKSSFTCGKASSTVGLTASVKTDPSSGEVVIDAGALALADGGVCCIDELDKMAGQESALLQAMSQGQLSINKAGVHETVSAKCSVLAAANPVGGLYKLEKTIAENVKLPPALLSRFDLIFLLLDSRNSKKDQRMIEHIMRLHNAQLPSISPQFFMTQETKFKSSVSTQSQLHGEQTQAFELLGDRLSSQARYIEQKDVLSAQELKNYILFARDHITVKLSEGAQQKIKQCYGRLIDLSMSEKGFLPMSPRMLENLIRLTIARAKLELRREATADDAEDVEQLVYEALLGSLALENGSKSYQEGLLRARKLGGLDLNLKDVAHLSKPKQTRVFLHNVKKLVEEKEDNVVSEKELVAICKRLNMNVGEDLRDYLERLNAQGVFLQQANRRFKFMGQL